MGDPRSTLGEFIELVVERKMREADVSDGSRVAHGSNKHIKDLEARIADLGRWRDKQRRGTEARATYSRLIARLKGELSSAQRAAEKAKTKAIKEAIEEPTASAEERWQALARSEDPGVAGIVTVFRDAATARDLSKIRKNVEQMIDAGQVPAGVSDGFVGWLYDQRKVELQGMDHRPRSAADVRVDRMARSTDSDGHTLARKMR